MSEKNSFCLLAEVDFLTVGTKPNSYRKRVLTTPPPGRTKMVIFQKIQKITKIHILVGSTSGFLSLIFVKPLL